MTIPFASVTYDPKTRLWTVEEDYNFNGFSVLQTILKGFITDLSSVPRIFWRIINTYELSVEAPLLHDYGYRNLGRFTNITLTRQQVDDLFYNIALEQGVPKWRCKLGYAAVRIAGWWTWRKYEKDLAANTAGAT